VSLSELNTINYCSNYSKRNKMLTQNELKFSIMIWKYACRGFVIGFIWSDADGGKLVVKKNQHRGWNMFLWVLILTVLACRGLMLSITLGNQDVNGSILQAVYLLNIAGNVLIRSNLVLYKTEMMDLANQLLYSNSVWGNLNYILT